MRHSLDGVACDAVPAEYALYPYGCFTTFVIVDGSVLSWDRHLARLARGTRAMWDHELAPAAITSALGTHLDGEPTGASTVRVTLFPASFDHLAPEQAEGCRILISSRPAESPFEAGPGLRVRTVQFRRDLPEVKSTGLTTQLHARREARLAGWDDALFLDQDRVLEGSTWSLVVLKDGMARTPAEGVLESITVHNLEAVLREMGWSFEHCSVSVGELRQAELVLAVNVNKPVRAIIRVDDDDLAMNSVLLKDLARQYSALKRTPLRLPRPG
ncbi:MAG: aminotransferase class IV [Nocardioides sp.]